MNKITLTDQGADWLTDYLTYQLEENEFLSNTSKAIVEKILLAIQLGEHE